MAFGAPSLKGRALRHLARREHSRAELERKLAKHAGEDEDAPAKIAAALDELAARGLQSEQRTAQSVLRTQGERYGSVRVKQALQAKGLAPELVAEAVAQARAADLANALDLWRRRFGGPAADAAGRARQARFLTARGFPSEVVLRVVKHATNNGGDD